MYFLCAQIVVSLTLLSGRVCLAQDTSSNVASALGFFPASQRFYSSGFVSPTPPTIQSEFRANYMQHKFDANISDHIVSGFIYVSPSQKKVRADGAGDGFLEASIFDFANTTANGTLVANSIVSFASGVTTPTCSSFFVAPFVEVFPDDFLAQSNAVFAGIQLDELYGEVSAWTFSQGSSLQVTFFLDSNDTFVRYDFAASDSLRTFATTRFFNIIPGPVNGTVFETSCT
ncbi:hypothetical protein HYPSUDRAFT_47956 [Hypholoma sublateritium FD-334 SS-4]|uniref:Glycoside hydrolase family 16 protein n=1 Tax=Hypholoma sublateritium (strain FD-334 SS-4) TaxID=945553 RepID=A0A0D2N9U0_HYPSF|nr:hypothetical protein HYPSUDRAFT_47956 [Hypholoma sublateritium FD-334 SS-4]